MLAVINLKDSWANLERTVEDFGLGIERLREIHIVLTWTAGMAEAVPSRQTVQEIAQACIGFVRESAGSGVTFANRVPHERAIQVPARLFFAALLATVSRILDLFCRLGNGRGSIELRSMEKDAFWRKRHAGRGGMWSARSLVLAARPEMPVDWQPHPAAGYEAGLFARLGAEPDWTIRGEILEIGFWLPETAGGPGGSDAG